MCDNAYLLPIALKKFSLHNKYNCDFQIFIISMTVQTSKYLKQMKQC